MDSRWGLLRRHLNGHKIVLDWGTATGCFLKECPDPELAVSGWDINPASPWHYLDPVINPDVLTCWDVIEHIQDPVQFILEQNPRMLAITTPSTDLLMLEKRMSCIREWKHYRPGEHLHYYNANALMALYDSCGYKVLEMNYEEGEKRNPERSRDIITMIGEKE